MRATVIPSLFTERLHLRALAAHDVPALLSLYGDPAVMRFWSHAPWSAPAQAVAAVGEAHAEYAAGAALHLAIAARDAAPGCAPLLGACALFDIAPAHRRATLGYLLARGHWGRGYAGEAVGALLAHGFGALGLRRVEAEVDPRNAASAQLLARLGFRCEGRLRGRWLVDGVARDVDMWARLRGDQDAAGAGADA